MSILGQVLHGQRRGRIAPGGQGQGQDGAGGQWGCRQEEGLMRKRKIFFACVSYYVCANEGMGGKMIQVLVPS